MIVAEVDTDLFESSAQTLVCPVNTEGAMGAGLALAFKQRFRGLEEAYRKACQGSVFGREGILIYEVPNVHSYTRKILCMPTKRRWALPSKLEWIDEALYIIARDWRACGLTSLAIPAVGCGKGQLEWKFVHELLYRWLDPIELEVVVHVPYGAPTEDPRACASAILAEV